MNKYERMTWIDYYHRRLINEDIDTQTCKLMVSNEIMRAWDDSEITGEDLYNILRHTNGIFQEIAKRIEQKKK